MSEFQAVVMAAGKGSRLTELTTHTSKALLPIANRPMVSYPVNMLARAGFTEAIMVVLDSEHSQVRKALADMDLTIQLDYVTISDTDELGTADTLRKIRDKINRDMLVVSCDLLADFSLHLLADVHRTNDATLTMLLTSAFDTSEISVPGNKANKKIEKELVGLDSKGNRVLFISSFADLDEDVTFKKSFFKKFPYIKMQSKLTDAHMYLIKKSVFDILDQKPDISTIRGELVPFLVKQQFHSNKKTSREAETNDLDNIDMETETEEDELMKTAFEMSTHGGSSTDSEISVFTHIEDGRFCMRANSILGYSEANKQVPRLLQNFTKEEEIQLIHPVAKISGKTQTGQDSMVGEGTSIGEKSSVKRSVIDSHCDIGSRTKISNSVIMNRVIIKEGCEVTGCIVCDEAVLDERCNLKDCIVGPGQHVKGGAKYTNENLVVDRMMEI